MAKVKAGGIKHRVYWTGSGKLDLSPEKARRAIANFHRMRKAGHKIPVPWGHRNDALPSAEDRQSHDAKYNAGFVEDAFLDSENRLAFLLDIPNPEDVARLSTVHGVSPEFRTNWRDGSGTNYDFCLTHCALVNHPVAHDQGPITQADDPAPAGTVRMSLTGVFRMDMDQDGNDLGNDTMPPPSEDVDDQQEDGQDDSSDRLNRLVDLMERAGVKLGEDVTVDNFLDRLEAAFNAIVPDEEEEGEPPPEPVEESPPLQMSLESVKSVLESDRRDGFKRRIHSLLRSRRIDKEYAGQLEAEAESYRFSVSDDGQPVVTGIERELRALERAQGPAVSVPAGKAEEPPHPDGEQFFKMSVDDGAGDKPMEDAKAVELVSRMAGVSAERAKQLVMSQRR